MTDSNVEIESESISLVSPSRTSTSSSPSRHMTIRRSSDLLTNLKVRSSVSHSVRSYLNDGLDFVEVETPTLFKSTPEGAREFLVPSRKRGKFYALTQSPQQYKQILMSAGTFYSLNSDSQKLTSYTSKGIPRYFQFARCYRDETGRADRQPEFTQIDLEMSFVTMNDVRSVAEGIVRNAFLAASKHLPHITSDRVRAFEFPVMSYTDAMNLYGTDKPDLRYDLCFFNPSHHNNEDQKISRGILAPQLGSVLSRKKIKELIETIDTNDGEELSVRIRVR